jgi:aminopeptidase N
VEDNGVPRRPVALDTPHLRRLVDTDSALLNFDGISYGKGAAVLKQLVAWVGKEPFFAGVRAYLREHEFANTELADLLTALERASGRDLQSWSAEWLQTAGVNTLRPIVEVRDGAYAAVAIEQSAATEFPTLRSPTRDRALRPHAPWAGPPGPG